MTTVSLTEAENLFLNYCSNNLEKENIDFFGVEITKFKIMLLIHESNWNLFFAIMDKWALQNNIDINRD